MSKAYAPGKKSSFRPPLTPSMSTSPTLSSTSLVHNPQRSNYRMMDCRGQQTSSSTSAANPYNADTFPIQDSWSKDAGHTMKGRWTPSPSIIDPQKSSHVDEEGLAKPKVPESTLFEALPSLKSSSQTGSVKAFEEEVALAAAFQALGLTSSASLSNELIAGVFQARVQDTPAQKEELTENLRKIAEFRNSSFLKGVLIALHLSAADARFGSSTTSEDNEDPLPDQLRADAANDDKIEWIIRKGDPVASNKRPEKVIQFRTTTSQWHDTIVDEDLGSGRKDGTVDNPKIWSGTFFSAGVVNIVAGDDCDYHMFFVNEEVVKELLHDEVFSVQLRSLETNSSVVLTDIQHPDAFAELLKLLSLGHELFSTILKNRSFDHWLHPALYGLARKFYFDSIAQLVLQALARENSFAGFLSGARKVYEFNYADGPFRKFFIDRINDTFADPTFAWSGKNKDSDGVGLGYTPVELLLKDALAVPKFGSDIYEVLVKREQTRALDQIKAEASPSVLSGDRGSSPDGSNVLRPHESTDGDKNGHENGWDCNVSSHFNKANDFSDGKTLFVANLPSSTTAKDVRDYFAANYGEVIAVSLLIAQPPAAQTTQGAYVTFASKHEARQAGCSWGMLYDDENTLYVSYPTTNDFLNYYGTMPWVTDSWELRSDVKSSQKSAGITAIAVKDSDDQNCTISFGAGARIHCVTGVALPPRSNIHSELPVPWLSGVSQGVVGTFPMNYVTFDVNDGWTSEVSDANDAWGKVVPGNRF